MYHRAWHEHAGIGLKPSSYEVSSPVGADPGVARSIVSDVDNLLRLISLFNILPPGMYVEQAAAVRSQRPVLRGSSQREKLSRFWYLATNRLSWVLWLRYMILSTPNAGPVRVEQSSTLFEAS